MRRILVAAICVIALSVAVPARAADFVWNFVGTGSQTGLAAQAVFHDNGGGVLQVTLTNLGATGVTSPSNVLTAVLFNCACGTLSAQFATTSGPTVGSVNLASGANVGGEWGFGTQTNINGSSFVITSMGAFSTLGSINSGPGNFVGGVDLDGQAALDGVDFGIVPTGNGPLPIGGNPAVTEHDVIFTFTGYNGANLATAVSGVNFQYGTSLGEFNSGGGTSSTSGQQLVPEPTSLLLFGSGLAATAYRARRKRQQKDR